MRNLVRYLRNIDYCLNIARSDFNNFSGVLLFFVRDLVKIEMPSTNHEGHF